MRYWLDTEFIERGAEYPIDLLSIGIVSEDDRTLYLEPLETDHCRASPWVQQNVIPHLHRIKHLGLDHVDCPVVPRREVAMWITEFCHPNRGGKPEFWGYYADYDWVVLCQLFGTMMDLPKGWPKYCRDIKQWCDDLGNPNLPEQGKGEHHALADAQWNKRAWEFLKDMAK